MNMLNENINTAVANSIMKNNSKCVSSTSITQQSNINCKNVGNITSNSNQTAEATVVFSCLQVNKSEQEMAQEILNSLVGQMKSNLNAKTLNNMNNQAESIASAAAAAQAAAASAAKTSGFLPIGNSNSSASSDSKSNSTSISNNIATNIYDVKTTTDNTANIQNVIKNNINATFDVENINTCITNVGIDQQHNVNCDNANNIDWNTTQNAGIKAIARCIAENGGTASIISKSATDLGVKILSESESEAISKIENKLKTSSESTSKSESKSESKATTSGIGASIPGCGDCCGCCDCFSGASEIVIIIMVILCFLCVISILVSSYSMIAR